MSRLLAAFAVACDVGRCFGRLAYLADAQSDYTRDAARGRFNPLAACFGGAATHQGPRLADMALQRLREAVTRLPLQLHQDVLSQLLSGALARKTMFACGQSEGGKVVRIPQAEKPAGQPKQPYWKSSSCCGQDCDEDPGGAIIDSFYRAQGISFGRFCLSSPCSRRS